MSPVALAFGILHLKNGSPTLLGWVLGSATISMLVVAPFGGVIADKFGRIRMAAIADTWGSIGLFIQAAFFIHGQVPIWVMLLYIDSLTFIHSTLCCRTEVALVYSALLGWTLQCGHLTMGTRSTSANRWCWIKRWYVIYWCST